jgi:hypothetical protein
MSKIDELNYPERANAYYLVNVPYVFSAIWKVVKPLLQPRTIARVKVLSGNGLEALRKMIDEEHIPTFLRDHETKVDCTSFNCSFHQSFWAHLQEQAASATPDSEEAPAAPDEAHVEAPRRRSRLHIGSKRRVSEEEKKASDISAIAPDPDQGRH